MPKFFKIQWGLREMQKGKIDWTAPVKTGNNGRLGAAAEAAETPHIRLDIHKRDGYFALICENSYARQETAGGENTETVPKHSLGLKIIGNIVKKYEGVLLTDAGENCFTVKLVIPLA